MEEPLCIQKSITEVIASHTGYGRTIADN